MTTETTQPQELDTSALADTLVTEIGEVEEQPPVGEETPPADHQPASSPAETAPESESVAQEAPEAPGASPAAPTFEAPDTWTKEAKEEWAKLPARVQQEVLKREQDFHNGITQYKVRAEVGQTFERVLAPYVQAFQQYNVNPYEHTARLLHTHATLVFGTPEQKVSMIQAIANDAGVDLSKISTSPQDAVNPAVEGMKAELHNLRSQVTNVAGELTASRKAELEKQINSFASDPANGYFWDVADEMVAIFRSDPKATLQSAYDKAVWANPVTRQKEIDRIAAQRATEERKAAQERAEKARKTVATNVKSSPTRGDTSRPTGSIDDTLRETLAEIRARS